ncbi:MAG TPA: cell division protein FtsZ [Aestuariivirgaceae bacterium]|nr:cell division protein FtsZ [Aestuariivirgaceae bacterium]
MTINLTVPNLSELKPRITVFGVGGAGGNAVNNMIESGLEGVEFVIANTDAQAMQHNAAQRRIQMGTALTQGLGAGSQPQVGAAAAEEALPEIMDHLAGAHMVFITAGMGGGTGTGAAPVIARASKEQGILTVGVITKPFHFEGQRRMISAERGIEQLAKNVDTLIVIPNQNLFRVANEKTTFAAAFAMADQVLYSGVASITELMTKEGLINLDFADVRAIMSEMGKAMMGTGEATGEKRAIEAAEAAISNPLLDDVSMRGARGLLISITGGPDLTLYEVDEAATRIREEVDPEANIILGATFDDSLEGTMRVSVVATGLSQEALSKSESSSLTEELSEPAQAKRAALYGFTGKQPIPVKRPTELRANPKPKAANAQHHLTLDDNGYGASSYGEPDTQGQAAGGYQEQQYDEHEETVQRQPARRAARAPRMPSLDEFPLQAQRQIQAQQNRIGEITEQAHHKRKGLFERLAGGLGRRDPAEPEAQSIKEPAMTTKPSQRAKPRAAEENKAQNTQNMSMQIDPELDEDQLEIPAFLRRQAN